MAQLMCLAWLAEVERQMCVVSLSLLEAAKLTTSVEVDGHFP